MWWVELYARATAGFPVPAAPTIPWPPRNRKATCEENTETREGGSIGELVDAQVLQVGDVNPEGLNKPDFLIVGSPTHGDFPSEEMDGLLKGLPDLEGVDVAAFGTRTKRTVFGYAAPKVARRLDKGGAVRLAPPEGFFVLGKKNQKLKHGPQAESTGLIIGHWTIRWR